MHDYWYEAVYIRNDKTVTEQGAEEAATGWEVIAGLCGANNKGRLIGARVWWIDENGAQAAQPCAYLRPSEEVTKPETKPNTGVRKSRLLENVEWALPYSSKPKKAYPEVSFTNEVTKHEYYNWY